MKINDFIFSDKLWHRVCRHLLFWVVVYLPLLGISLTQFVSYNGRLIMDWPLFIKWQFIYVTSLGADILYTYTIVYHLIPRYRIRRNRIVFALQLILLTILIFVVSGIAAVWHYQHLGQSLLLDIWLHVLIFINSGPIIRLALFLFVKELKTYYERMEEKISLVRENGRAELQLLQAQVHPHFLFNTLNNIYSFALNRSPDAGQLIAKLSSTLDYMITDCEEPLVSLEKEIKVLNDYLGLEKIRYGNRLDLKVQIVGNTRHKLIAPLLMIPFVENSFKHGTSKVLEHPWIDLKISIYESTLEFNLINSKPGEGLPISYKGGIGLKNVQQRLQLLYPRHHELRIDTDDQSFTVMMTLPLQTARVLSGQEGLVINT